MSDNQNTNYCYGPPFTLEGILSPQQSQFHIYKQGWADFNRIQAYNSNVSTLRTTTGDSNLTYYQYVSYAERDSFRIGQYLHQRQYPNFNWNSIN